MSEVDRLRDRIEQLEAMLGIDFGLANQLMCCLHFSPSEAKLVGMLLKREAAGYEAICDALWGMRCDKDMPTDPLRLVHVHMSRARRKLKEINVTVETGWGNHYRLSPQNKRRLRAFVDKEITCHIEMAH